MKIWFLSAPTKRVPIPKLDYAISKINQVNDFLMQKVDEKFTYEEIIAEMERILAKPKDAKEK